MKTMTKVQQERITPADALKLLVDGNRRFIGNLKINRNLLQQVNETREGQHPFAVIISCMDSRTSAELIFDQGLGDIFSIRIAGNIINDEILGSAEFGCKIVGAKIIVVLGHTGCGAIKGAIDNVKLGKLDSVLDRIKPAMPSEHACSALSTEEKIAKLTENNVRKAISDVRSNSPIIATMEREGQLKLVGAIYDVVTANVKWFDAAYE